MTDLRGVIPYLPTPLGGAGEVDRAAVERLCDHLIGAGVHGLCPLGSTGEFAYLTAGQKQAMIEATVAAAKGRVPVVAGVAATATDEAVRQTRAAEAAGANGILAIMEAYFPVSEANTVAYFEAVAEATTLPVTLYTNPNFQRSDLSVPAIERLSHHPRIRYLKDASTNTGRLLTVMGRCGDRLGIFAASSHITTAVMLIGGLGWMAGPSCLVPAASVRLFELCRAGDWDGAMTLQRRLWPMNELFARYNLAATVKAGLRLQGIDCGPPLPPQAPVPEDGLAALRSALAALDALPG